MALTLLVSVGLMALLGAILSLVLSLAHGKLRVDEDPLVDDVDTMLPGANCGACGLPGCRAFAESAVDGHVAPAACTVAEPAVQELIADLIGVEVGEEEQRVARLACAGGTNVARQRAKYVGEPTCVAADLVGGGGKGCAWGCLGYADCMAVCDFDAITMDQHSLPVVDDSRCTACGDCVDVCPRDLFSIQPISHRLWVACKNEAFGDTAEAECEVACTACGLCAADAPGDLVTMLDNLPVVDYGRNQLATPDAIDRCPTGAILWLRSGDEPLRGAKATHVLRRSALPVG